MSSTDENRVEEAKKKAKDDGKKNNDQLQQQQQLDLKDEMKQALADMLPLITEAVSKHVEAKYAIGTKRNSENTEPYNRDDAISIEAGSPVRGSSIHTPPGMRDSQYGDGSALSYFGSDKENNPPHKKQKGQDNPMKHTGQFNPITTQGQYNPQTGEDVIPPLIQGKVNPMYPGQVNPPDTTQDIDMVEETLREIEDTVEFYKEFNPPITQGLADKALKFYKAGQEQREPRSTLFKKNMVAANLAEIDTPRINPGVLELRTVQKYHKHNEAKLFDIQQNVTRATMAVLNIAEAAIQEERRGHTISLKNVLNGALESTLLLGHVSHELSTKRKSNLRNCLDSTMQSLCDADKPTTKWLFGDDVFKSADEASKLQRLARKMPNPKSQHTSSTQSSSGHTRDQQWNKQSSSSRTSGQNNYDKSSKSTSGKGKQPFLEKGPKPKSKR
jgi:hypothetical protein